MSSSFFTSWIPLFTTSVLDKLSCFAQLSRSSNSSELMRSCKLLSRLLVPLTGRPNRGDISSPHFCHGINIHYAVAKVKSKIHRKRWKPCGCKENFFQSGLRSGLLRFFVPAEVEILVVGLVALLNVLRSDLASSVPGHALPQAAGLHFRAATAVNAVPDCLLIFELLCAFFQYPTVIRSLYAVVARSLLAV